MCCCFILSFSLLYVCVSTASIDSTGAELKKRTKKPGGGTSTHRSFRFCFSHFLQLLLVFFFFFFFFLFFSFFSSAVLWIGRRGGPLRTSSTWRVASAALVDASSNVAKPPYGQKVPWYRQLFAILGTKWM